MKSYFVALAVIASCLSIVLALDLGRFGFTQVDIGGHELRMLITGQGSPAVVFEAGGSPASGAALEDWDRVQPAVSKFTCTVAYDRAGIGWSTPGPKPRDARQVARELHTALEQAHVPPPYVLVGHSFGGPLNRVFADLYPEEVAGLVLLDPTQEEFIDWNRIHHPDPEETQSEDWKDMQASLSQARESRVPSGVPVFLITAMGPRKIPGFMTEKQKEELKQIRPMWLKFHNQWLERIPNSRHIITEDSGHGIHFETPQLVISTIQETVKSARSSFPRISYKP